MEKHFSLNKHQRICLLWIMILTTLTGCVPSNSIRFIQRSDSEIEYDVRIDDSFNDFEIELTKWENETQVEHRQMIFGECAYFPSELSSYKVYGLHDYQAGESSEKQQSLRYYLEGFGTIFLLTEDTTEAMCVFPGSRKVVNIHDKDRIPLLYVAYGPRTQYKLEDITLDNLITNYDTVYVVSITFYEK